MLKLLVVVHDTQLLTSPQCASSIFSTAEGASDRQRFQPWFDGYIAEAMRRGVDIVKEEDARTIACINFLLRL
ncbi:hypothetical protein D1920_12645 [Rhodopseudomonas palustris]|nr:hypothetical protein D1920_12645 [Rhodopseudomonas palustris]